MSLWWDYICGGVACWFRGARLDNSLSRNEAFLRAAERRARRREDRLNDSARQLELLRGQMDAVVDEIKVDLEESRRSNAELTTQLSGSQQALRVMEESTVPGLVASHKLLVARWDAETAVQVRTQMASMGTPIQE